MLTISRLREECLTVLTDGYVKWQAEQSLQLSSADEHVTDENLTLEQRQWLQGFCRLWDRTAE